MTCPSCGGETADDKEFCHLCGKRILKNPLTGEVSQMNSIPKDRITNIDTTDAFAMKYLGIHYNSFADGVFSLWAFIFGPLYYFYRKLNIYGIIAFVISVLLTVIVNSISHFFGLTAVNLYFLIHFIFNVVLGLAFKPLYMYYIRKNKDFIKVNAPTTDILNAFIMCIVSLFINAGIFLVFRVDILNEVSDTMSQFYTNIVNLLERISDFLQYKFNTLKSKIVG